MNEILNKMLRCENSSMNLNLLQTSMLLSVYKFSFYRIIAVIEWTKLSATIAQIDVSMFQVLYKGQRPNLFLQFQPHPFFSFSISLLT